MLKLTYVFLQAILSFVVLFIISKILGKKQVAQLEFIDYVVGISIGSIAAQMATEPKIPFYHFIVAMVVFGGLDLAFSLLSRKANFLKEFFKGKPLILIKDGEIDYKNLKKSKLDVNDLISQCRAKGFFKISDIAFCIFENSGDFSIMPKSENKNLSPEDVGLNLPSAKLEAAVVIDGKINSSSLSSLNKDENWLMEKIGFKTKKEINEIILAVYDEEKDEIKLNYKKKS